MPGQEDAFEKLADAVSVIIDFFAAFFRK